MKTKILVFGTVILAAAFTATAAESSTNWIAEDNLTNQPSFNLSGTSTDELYRSWEVSIEAFAVGTVSQYKNPEAGSYEVGHHRADVGGGAGVEFFFCKYVGIEAEGISLADERDFVHSAGGNVVLRLPIGDTGLAPYVFGGGGQSWDDHPTGYGDAGAGLEYRFTPMIGIFVDARAMITVNDGNYGLGRLGVKFAF